jgi:hypothetical protein
MGPGCECGANDHNAKVTATHEEILAALPPASRPESIDHAIAGVLTRDLEWKARQFPPKTSEVM